MTQKPRGMEHRTIQEHGYCTRSGYARLDQVLGQLCELGNAALQERRDAWKMQRERISYQDQCRSLTLVRQDDPDGLGRLSDPTIDGPARAGMNPTAGQIGNRERGGPALAGMNRARTSA